MLKEKNTRECAKSHVPEATAQGGRFRPVQVGAPTRTGRGPILHSLGLHPVRDGSTACITCACARTRIPYIIYNKQLHTLFMTDL